MMTGRERIKAVMDFRKPDVLPWCEKFYDEGIIGWLTQGLPADKTASIEWVMREGNISIVSWPRLKGFDLYSYFGISNFQSLVFPIDLGPIPRYKIRAISETERYVDFVMGQGSIARRFKRAEYIWYSMPMFLDFPVKDRRSWEEYKRRLDPHAPCRYPKDWDKPAYIEDYEKHTKGTTCINIPGFYGFGAELMGIPSFVSMFYKDPELMRDMVSHWEYFTIETLRDVIETLQDRIDLIYWWEDLAEKNGPCISPRIYKEFLLPHYRNVTSFFRKNKIKRVMMDSDGNIHALLDLVSEAGINGLWPLEVNAGMNAVELKKKYGSKFFLLGNLDKRELAEGGERMRREVDSKVPILKEMGGYIPTVDHNVHVEFTLDRFREYAEYIKSKLNY